MNLTSPVTQIPGVGTIMAGKLAKLGITSVFDLLYHLPFRYEDRRQISLARTVQVGETVTLVGHISTVKNIFTKNGKRLQQTIFTDASGTLPVIWFNQMFLSRVFSDGDQVTLYGKVDFFSKKPTLISPQYEKISGIAGNEGIGIVPIYPETAGLTSKWLRSKIQLLVNSLPDISPLHLASLQHMHAPDSPEIVDPARKI